MAKLSKRAKAIAEKIDKEKFMHWKMRWHF